jgi:tetratricopeptide (TPR) repeat protein
LRTVLSCSLCALSVHGARTFRLLGLAPGRDFSAAAVAALTGLDPVLADRAIGELVDAHLLDEPTAGRYSFHDLLRACARELALQVEPVAADEARGRLFGWYVHAASAADHALDYRDRRYPHGPVSEPEQMPVFAGHEQAEAWFTAEHENITEVVAAAAERGVDSAAWDLAIIPWNYYHRHNLNDEWLHVLQIGLKAVRVREGGTHGEQTVYNMLGLCYRRRGELPEAIDAYEKCIAIARTLEGVYLHVLLNNLAMAYLYSDRGLDALKCLEEALATPDGFGAKSVKVLNNMGEAHRHLGQFEQALPYLERGLAIASESADPAAVYLLATLGETHLSLAHFPEAAEYCGQGLDMLQGMEYPSVTAKLLADQGSARHALGDHAGARASWEEALDIYERLDVPEAADLRARLADLR